MVTSVEPHIAAEKHSAMKTIIYQWIDALPEGCVSVQESELEFESVIELTSNKTDNPPVQFRIGKGDGAFDVGMGEGIFIDDIPFSADHLKNICRAIEMGKYKDILWKCGGKTVISKGELYLSDDQILESSYIDAPLRWIFCKLLRKLEKIEIYYKPL